MDAALGASLRSAGAKIERTSETKLSRSNPLNSMEKNMKHVAAIALIWAVTACATPVGGSGGSGGGTGDASAGGDTAANNGADTGLGTPGATNTPLGFCQAYIDASCDQAVACHKWASKATCLSSPKNVAGLEDCAVSMQFFNALVAAGKLSWNPGQFIACVQAAAKVCGGVDEDACFVGTLVGKRKPGDPCLENAECMPKARCAQADNAAPCEAGVCQLYADVGQSCGTGQGRRVVATVCSAPTPFASKRKRPASPAPTAVSAAAA